MALAAQAAGSLDGAAIRDHLRDIGSPPGQVVPGTPGGVADALRLLADGGQIDYEGGATTLDWDANGDLREGYIGVWRFTPDEGIEEVETVFFREVNEAEAVRWQASYGSPHANNAAEFVLATRDGASRCSPTPPSTASARERTSHSTSWRATRLTDARRVHRSPSRPASTLARRARCRPPGRRRTLAPCASPTPCTTPPSST